MERCGPGAAAWHASKQVEVKMSSSSFEITSCGAVRGKSNVEALVVGDACACHEICESDFTTWSLRSVAFELG